MPARATAAIGAVAVAMSATVVAAALVAGADPNGCKSFCTAEGCFEPHCENTLLALELVLLLFGLVLVGLVWWASVRAPGRQARLAVAGAVLLLFCVLLYGEELGVDPFHGLPGQSFPREPVVLTALVGAAALIGRWWAVALALAPFVLLLPLGGNEEEPPVAVYAILVFPWVAGLLAVGVALRKAALRRRPGPAPPGSRRPSPG